ncbi:MAG: hypothetical protein O3A38_01140 [Proteobacteria bacterium]|nr:hypothetical protein [Pseudomonadota bacterium]
MARRAVDSGPAGVTAPCLQPRAVHANRVNPLYIDKIEQIHILLRNRFAIPQMDDLL